MRIIIVGGSGTIGSAVTKELSKRHEILVVGSKGGDLICDMNSLDSIKNMYKKAGKFDAVVVAAGSVHFEEFSRMTQEKYWVGLNSKLMGQINLVIEGCHGIQEKGSFTLTSGILSCDPIRSGTSASMVNGALDCFVRSAAIELPKSLRINVVSPTILSESLDMYGSYFYGYETVPVSKVALAYCKSVEGLQTGQVYTVGY